MGSRLNRIFNFVASFFKKSNTNQVRTYTLFSAKSKLISLITHLVARVTYFFNEWVLTTNHRKIAVLYFIFVGITGFTGLILATVIRLELAYPGQFFLTNNAERYLTVISLHGIVMVFFFVIPVLFGAFGNFLLPTQLGIRDVAFPRLNSFMFWVTPAGFVMLLHIIMFDKNYNLTYWINYSETKAQLRRRYDTPNSQLVKYNKASEDSVMAWRFLTSNNEKTRNNILQEVAPLLTNKSVDLYSFVNPKTIFKTSLFKNLSNSYFALVDSLQSCVFILLKTYNITFAFSPSATSIHALDSLYRPSSAYNTIYSLIKSNNFNLNNLQYLYLIDMPFWNIKPLLTLLDNKYTFQIFTKFVTLSNETPVNLYDYTATRMWGNITLPSTDLYLNNNVYLLINLVNANPVTTNLNIKLPTAYKTNKLQILQGDIFTAPWELRAVWFYALANSNSNVFVSTLEFFSHKSTYFDLYFFLTSKLFLSNLLLKLLSWNTLEINYDLLYKLAISLYTNSYHIILLDPVILNNLKLLQKPLQITAFLFSLSFDSVKYYAFWDLIFKDISSVCSDKKLLYFVNLVFNDQKLYNFIGNFFLSEPVIVNNLLALSSASYGFYFDTRFGSKLKTLCSFHSANINYWTNLNIQNLIFNFSRTWEWELMTKLITMPNLWATDILFNVAWPSQAKAAIVKYNSQQFNNPKSKPKKSNIISSQDFGYFAAQNNLSKSSQLKTFNSGASQALFDMTAGYCLSLWRLDYLNDWRELKLEREIWRSIDTLSGAKYHLLFKKKYYSNFYEPSSLLNKVSTWLPNHLLPGWAFVTPYSSRLRYTALGKVDVALIVVFAASLGSIFSSVNYVITYRYIGAPTLKNRRELRSFFVDALLVASRMMILANPALMIGIILLLSDRHFNTSVFDFSGGGDTILFQHLFWFFGHPEVYIIIIPCFGIMNSLLPYYLRKRLSGRLSLQFSMYTIAFMSFAVWGHHMYMVGLANSVRTLYSTMTVMISVPASTKVIHWCVTLIQSTLTLDVGFLFLLSFMYFFVLGGLSGMFVAHIGFDTIFHDTFYVIGHFHVMFAGAAVCCIFAAFYFYFPAIFGVRYSKFFAYLHFGFYMAGQLLTLIPMFWLGYAGMPRRIMDYPSSFGGWHSVISSGHILTVISFAFFLMMLVDSFYEGRAPISKTKGVSRVNTRFSFYLYEIRKLQSYQTKSLILLRNQNLKNSKAELYKFCWKSEMTNFEYTFKAK